MKPSYWVRSTLNVRLTSRLSLAGDTDPDLMAGGEMEVWLISDKNKVYYVEVSDGKWTGGTIKEFVGRMQLYMWEILPNHQLVFDPQSGVSNSFAESPEAFFEVFGRPASDIRDLEKSIAPPILRERNRKWRYDLKDGSMHFRVAPAQDGNILIKSGQ